MIIERQQFIGSKWLNGLGETMQLVISPPNSDFKSQEFEYRISIASLTTNASAFSKFAEYRRWLAVLQGGPVHLTNKSNASTYRLEKLKEIVEFDGGDELTSTAETNGKDFNLFLRKGRNVKDQTILNIKEGIHYFYNCDSQSLHFQSKGQKWTILQGQLFQYRINGQLTIRPSNATSTIIHCILNN